MCLAAVECFINVANKMKEGWHFIEARWVDRQEFCTKDTYTKRV